MSKVTSDFFGLVCGWAGLVIGFTARDLAKFGARVWRVLLDVHEAQALAAREEQEAEALALSAYVSQRVLGGEDYWRSIDD